jgi:hypothetical protein
VQLHTKSIQSYIWVTKKKQCWETRGLNREDQLGVATGSYENRGRELTQYLNNWAPIAAALKSNQALAASV